MGALSKEEQEKEFIFLNPTANGMKNAMRDVIKTKIRSALCDEEQMEEVRKKMFEPSFHDGVGSMRSIHPDIPPPDTRIKQFKTKGLKQIFDAENKVKEHDMELIKLREARTTG